MTTCKQGVKIEPMFHIPGPRMILFFFFVTRVLCSFRLNDLIVSLKDETADQANVLENIIIESLKVKYDYSTNTSRFGPILTKMGMALEKPRKEVQKLIFSAYADYAKKICVDAVVKFSKRIIVKEDLLTIISNIGYLIIEAGVLALADPDFRIPDSYNVTFLRTLNTLNQVIFCNISAFMGIVQHCQSDSCFDVFSTIYLEGLRNGTFSLSVFITSTDLTETASFDRFVQTIFDLNQNGQAHKYPSVTIAKIIANGPTSIESLKIFLRLLDENIIRDLSNSKFEYILLSHKFSVCGMHEQFISTLNSLSNRNLKPNARMIEIFELNNENYQIIQNVMNINFNEIRLSGLLEFRNYVNSNNEALKSYHDQMHIYCFDFINRINTKIVEILDLVPGTSSNIAKRNYIKTILALMNFSPKHTRREFPSISIDRLFDHLLEPNNNKDFFTSLELVTIRKSLDFPWIEITRITLLKYARVFAKFEFKNQINFEIVLISMIIANARDARTTVEKFKMAYEFSDFLELDWGNVTSLLMGQLRHLDPFYFNEWISYCAGNNLLSKSHYLLIKKFIKTL